MILRIPLGCLNVSPTWLSHAPVGLPMPFGYILTIPQRGPYPVNIATYGFASSTFARHYSRNLVWFLFLRVLRCFSSPGSPHNAMYSRYAPWLFIMGVSPFGNPRIEAYLQLPVAYRSLSRPSSAPDAKAFALCSLSLELSLDQFPWSCCSLFELLEFHKQIFSGSILQLKGLSFFLHWIISTFRWNCNFTHFWKDQILFDYC